MADPLDPTPDTAAMAEEAAKALNAQNQATNDVVQSMNTLNGVSSVARNMFSALNTTMNGYGLSLDKIGSLTDKQAAQFSILTTSIIGTRKAFDGLSGIDPGNIRTFLNQFEEFQTNLDNSPAFGTVKEKIKAVTDMLGSASAPIKDVKNAAQGGLDGLTKYARSFFEAADNGLRLQNVLIQLAGRTGNLGEIYKKAGDNLSDMNSIMAHQNAIISETVKATGLNEKTVEQYYTALGMVPKALSENITGLSSTAKSTNMLTATIQLATGTGRKYEEVISDLHTAFKDYGLVGEDALKFTNRFSDVSTSFGVELEDVRTNLLGAASAFKSFTDAGASAGKMSEGLSGIMNDYVGALKNTDMTGQDAMRVVKGMTDSIAGMSVAQKAFLSSQTGGPGGLMGAFQIEKDLREGKIYKVFDKVRQTMQKQFGKIVTLDEAANSPAAASQLQKQMLLLQKGPLGSMAKSDQDAYRILESMRAKQDGKSPADMGARGLDPNSLSKSIERGAAIESKSKTPVSVVNENVAAIRRAADVIALNVVQKGGTAGLGAKDFLGADTQEQINFREKLNTNMTRGSERAGALNEDFKTQGANSSPYVNRVGTATVDAVNDTRSMMDQIAGAVKAPMDTVKQMLDLSKFGDNGAADFKKDINNAQNIKQQFNQEYENSQVNKIDNNAVLNNASQVKNIKKPAPAPEVFVTNEDSSSGRFKVNVKVDVVEENGQSRSITPAN